MGEHYLDRDDLIIHRIDMLLRGQPPPPVDVLEQVVQLLQRARGANVPSSSSRPAAVHRQGEHQHLRSEKPCRPASPHYSGMLSLQIGLTDKSRASLPQSTLFHVAAPSQHVETSTTQPILNIREKKTRELQVRRAVLPVLLLSCIYVHSIHYGS